MWIVNLSAFVLISLLGSSCKSVGCCDGEAAEAAELKVPKDSYEFEYRGEIKTVYKLFPDASVDSGFGILLLHELTGLSPETFRLARMLAAEGFEVHVPLMFGKAGKSSKVLSPLHVMVSKDWKPFTADASGEILPWLRGLCRRVSADTDGRGIGVVGMCLTGSLPVALLREPCVVAPVVSQPAVPMMAFTAARKRAMGLHPTDLDYAWRRVKNEGLKIMGFRFEHDKISPGERFIELKETFGAAPKGAFSDRSVCYEQYRGDGYVLEDDAHSVLTAEFCNLPQHPSFLRVKDTVEFMQAQLAEQGHLRSDEAIRAR